MENKMNNKTSKSNGAKIKKKKKLDVSNSGISESGDIKRKKSKLKKKKSNSKVVPQNIQQASDDNESDNICEFSDGEDTDDTELKNDVDKFIKGLNFERCSKEIHFSDDEEDEYNDVSQSPKKKKLKSNKDETKIEIPDGKKCKNMNKKLKISEGSCQSESNEIILKNKSTEQESKKSKKSKKNKNGAEELKIDLEGSPNTSRNESKSNENVNLMKKESSITAKLSPKNLNKQTKNDAEDKKNEMMEKLKKQLQSASFRLMNEKLYTSSGTDAQKMFKEDPNSFNLYHDGYSHQVAEWPVKPLNLIISWLNKKPKNWIVADFGCGTAILAKNVKQKVHSLDLRASSPDVIECDMANTPLESNSVNVVVFCLSLMGTYQTDFILEANRVLVDRGVLKIAEIESRFEKNLNQFLKVMSFLGFKIIHKNQNQNYFWLFDFIKIKSGDELTSRLPQLKLKPCIYKKR